MSTVLIVDDEAHLRRLLGMVLREEGYAVLEAGSVAQARARLADADAELVITDQKLGDGDGLAVLAAARELATGTPVLFLTTGTDDHEPRQMGAVGFVVRPSGTGAILSAIQSGPSRAIAATSRGTDGGPGSRSRIASA